MNPPAGQNVVRNLLNMSPHLLQALLSSASQVCVCVGVGGRNVGVWGVGVGGRG